MSRRIGARRRSSPPTETSTSTPSLVIPSTMRQTQELDAQGRNRLRWVQRNYMIYNYYSDSNRFAQRFPPECNCSRF
ncbi:xyloglucan:xyloglucosyl transferase [Salvia divinorum]|uniref:Xyloglucan:xyloglucosyl transferase n=1 Tax=Salvia divinorum TaxID=28513 RepID=A0ABD1I265_SALDI